MACGSESVTSLYAHVPFCARKCSYCAFYSEASSGELISRYTDAVVRELEFIAGNLEPRTVFFGGGTPSLLNLRQWERILAAMERLGLLGAEEFTVECNPATVSIDKARLLRSFGVNRVSMGVQSLDEDLLDRLGRVHTRSMVFRSWEILRQAGFDNLNLDLMFAIPGQTMPVWRETLREALSMGSEHLSCYEVIYEEDTALWSQLQAGVVREDEDLACAMYEELLEKASGAGFISYEIANLARDKQGADSAASAPAGKGVESQLPGYACRHNVNYWRGGSFYGVGPSATSYVQGRRWKNWSNTVLYCERMEQASITAPPGLSRGQAPPGVEWSEELAPLARAGETAAFGLRMTSGWPLALFKRTTGFDLPGEWRAEIDELVRRGWGELSSDRFRLTPVGSRFADAAAELFLR